MAEQPQQLTAEERRRNVQRVRDAAGRLERLVNALAAVEAQVGPLRREVEGIQEDIERALAGAPGEKEEETDGQGD